MANIYGGYPRELRTKQLVQAIDEYANEINASGVNINKVLQFSPYISLGLNELQSRQNRWITAVTLTVGLASLAVGGLALYVSVESGRSTDEAVARQITVMDQTSKHLLESRRLLSEILAVERQQLDAQANMSLHRTSRDRRP